jgi:ribosomal protein S12 methylthiotransferase accessory factor
MDISITFPGDKRVAAHFNGFTVVMDQPVAQGGGGTAPDPFDLFFASIAACAAYYARNFCLERNIPTDGLDVSMRTERDEKKKMTTKIVINVKLPADFPSKYEAALFRSIELCTVKKHIENPPEFETNILK